MAKRPYDDAAHERVKAVLRGWKELRENNPDRADALVAKCDRRMSANGTSIFEGLSGYYPKK